MASEESLSACLDGELSAAELDGLLASMAADRELAAAASRWSALRQVIQGQPAPLADAGFADRVMAAIGDAAPLDGGVSGRVVPLRSRAPRWSRAWRPAAGLAAAAVVGAVAVNYLPREQGAGSAPAGLTDVAALDEAPVIPVEAPVARLATAGRSAAPTQATRFAAVSAQAPAALVAASGAPSFDVRFSPPPRMVSSWERQPVQRFNSYYIDYAEPRGLQGQGMGGFGYGGFSTHGADLRAE